MTPRVSVVIPCYNAASWIRETLSNLYRQDLEDFEVIVVDDGSTDESASIIEKEFGRAKLIRLSNGGPSRARNAGTRLASGEFIQYLDADDLIEPRKFRVQIEALERAGADIAYCDWQNLVRDATGCFVKGEVHEEMRLRQPEVNLLTTEWFPIHAYLYRRSIVEKIDGWNETLSVIQDARFTLDCAMHGARFVYCPGVMAYYRMLGSGSVSTRSQTAFTEDCFRNASQVEDWWRCHNGIDKVRHHALIRAYEFVARASFSASPLLFKKAYEALCRLRPGYRPSEPRLLALVSCVLGYPRAEFLAFWYRRIKRFFWRQ